MGDLESRYIEIVIVYGDFYLVLALVMEIARCEISVLKWWFCLRGGAVWFLIVT